MIALFWSKNSMTTKGTRDDAIFLCLRKDMLRNRPNV